MKTRFSSVLLALFFLACSDPGEFASFDALPVAPLPNCLDEAFPLELSLLAAQKRADSLGIFLKTTPDITSRSDLVYFEIFDPEQITPGEEIEVRPQGEFATGKLTFFSSCPFQQESYNLEGALRFDSFNYEHLGVISGEFFDAQAFNARTGELVFDDFQGSWSFAVRRGPPYEDFYALPERPTPDDS